MVSFFFTTLPNWSVMEKLNFPKFSAYRWLVYIKWECGQAWSRIVLCDVWCHLFNTTFYSLRVIFTTNLFNAFTLIKKDYFFRNHRREDKRALLNELWKHSLFYVTLKSFFKYYTVASRPILSLIFRYDCNIRNWTKLVTDVTDHKKTCSSDYSGRLITASRS